MPTTPYFFIPLILFLGALLYCIWVMKREEYNFEDQAKTFQLGPIQLKVPPWWTPKNQIENKKVSFYRSDTHYDWLATFQVMPLIDQSTPMESKLIQQIQKKEILFDQQEAILKPSSKLMEKEFFQNKNISLLHVEGMATQGEIERIYYDVYLMVDDTHQLEYLFESRSSVLNGSVEGPYFEKVIEALSFIKT